MWDNGGWAGVPRHSPPLFYQGGGLEEAQEEATRVVRSIENALFKEKYERAGAA